MATLILDDVDAADGVVVDAIVATCRRHHGVDLRGGRVRALLARSVYRRCVGALAMRERFSLPRQPVAPLGSASASPALAWMSERQRCTMALTLFGGLSLPEAARTLELPPVRVVCHLQDILTAMSTAATVSMSEPADRALTTLEREPTVGATIRWA